MQKNDLEGVLSAIKIIQGRLFGFKSLLNCDTISQNNRLIYRGERDEL